MVTLRGIAWDHPRGRQAVEASSAPYKEKTGVNVEWQARSLKDFGDAPIDKLADEYDLLIFDHPHCGLADKTGCLLKLEDYIDTDTMQTLADQSAGPSHISYLYNNHQWGLAIDAAMQAASYRPDLYEGDFPRTWNGVVELGKRLDGTGKYIAIPLVPTDCICSFLSLCAAFGDPPGTDDSGALLTNDNTGIQALETLIALKNVAHPNALMWNPIWMYDHMSVENDVVYCPLAFTYTNYARDGYSDKLIQFTNIPGVKGSILGGAGFGVSSKCQHPQEAVDYGVWLCGGEVQSGFYVDEGGQPGNRLAWESDRANTITHNFFKDTYDTLDNAYVRPRHHGYHVFQEESGKAIHAMLKDNTDPATCLEAVKALYAASLG